MQWATSADITTRASLLGGGASPVRQSNFDDPRIKAKATVGIGTTRHFAITLDAINNRMGTEPHLPAWPSLSVDRFAVELGKMITGQQSVKTTLDTMATHAEQAVQRDARSVKESTAAQARGPTTQMSTLPSRDNSLPRMMSDPGAMRQCGTWLNRAVARGWHLLTGKLRTKLLVAFLGVALCPLLLIAYRDAEVTRSALTASAYQALFAAASQTALRLDTFIAATANVIGTQAQMPPLGEYLSLPAADQKPAESRMVDILQAFAQKNPAFTSSVAVLDLHGRVALDTQPANVGLDESATDYFRSALETGLPHAAQLEVSASDGKPYLHFSSVVHAPDGRPVGVLRERYSAVIVQQMVAENNRLVGPRSFALVLNEDGLLLADGHLSPGQLSDGLFKATKRLDPSRMSELRAHRLLPGELAQDIGFPGLAEGLEQAGRPAPYFTLQLSNTGSPQYAAAVAHMQTQPWLVVFVQPQDVFLTPVRAQT